MPFYLFRLSLVKVQEKLAVRWNLAWRFWCLRSNWFDGKSGGEVEDDLRWLGLGQREWRARVKLRLGQPECVHAQSDFKLDRAGYNEVKSPSMSIQTEPDFYLEFFHAHIVITHHVSYYVSTTQV